MLAPTSTGTSTPRHGRIVWQGKGVAPPSRSRFATKVPVGSDYGVAQNWRIVRNHFEAGSGVTVRPQNNGSSVICGNTGSVPSASWATACP
jgi:hypothetical protein